MWIERDGVEGGTRHKLAAALDGRFFEAPQAAAAAVAVVVEVALARGREAIAPPRVMSIRWRRSPDCPWGCVSVAACIEEAPLRSPPSPVLAAVASCRDIGVAALSASDGIGGGSFSVVAAIAGLNCN